MKHIKRINEDISAIKKVILMKSIEKIYLEDGQIFFRHSSVSEDEEWYDENENYIRDDNTRDELENMYNNIK